MTNYQPLLRVLLQHTEDLQKQVESIHSNLKQNEPEDVEKIQGLVEKRESIIQQLDKYVKQADFQWSSEDKHEINRLQQLENEIQPQLNRLYQSFTEQIKRMNQTKQVSKKYIGAYQNMITDGSFIDKRK